MNLSAIKMNDLLQSMEQQIVRVVEAGGRTQLVGLLRFQKDYCFVASERDGPFSSSKFTAEEVVNIQFSGNDGEPLSVSINLN